MKCLWCGEPVEFYESGMYLFCNRCLANLETLGLDLSESERKLERRLKTGRGLPNLSKQRDGDDKI